MPTAWDTDLLAEMVDRRFECLTQLRDLGQHQDSLISDASLGELLKLLAVKQRILNTLQQIERQLDPFRNQNPEQRQWRSETDRKRCAEVSNRCQALMSEIVSQEQRSEQELRRRRDEVVGQLQGMHQSSIARGAYHLELSAGPRQLDLSSEG